MTLYVARNEASNPVASVGAGNMAGKQIKKSGAEIR
jgi:hypothetical protein